jgi:pre-mRNA-processing factor 19
MAGSSPYTGAQFHPDGLLLVTGTADAKAQIWEMRQQKAVTGFEAGERFMRATTDVHLVA